ncbi:MAG: glycine zipper domain-containing protein [Planctomycetota bacterium]
MRNLSIHRLTVCSLLALSVGCASPYRADQGALFGGLLGAGTGAVIGNALGNTGAGAAIGAGVGALSGAAVGSELDSIEAQNRAMIAQQMGRQVSAGAVTFQDVIAMTQAGVNEELIVNHVRAHGVATPLQASDIIMLQQQQVSARVIAAMQETRAPAAASAPPVVYQQVPQPVIVEEHIYGGPYWGPPRCYHPPVRRYHRHSPGVTWGFSFHN